MNVTKNNIVKAITSSNQEVEEIGPRVNPALPLGDQESIAKLWNIINSGKTYAEILEYVQNEISESTRLVKFNYKVQCFLSDGAYALSRAVELKVGYATQTRERNPSGEKPPTMIDVSFADGSHKKVPFGKIDLPTFGGEAFVDMKYDQSGQTLFIQGQCEKRYIADLDKVIDLTKKILKEDSIYKGKALKFILNKEPEFINLSGIENKSIYLTKSAEWETKAIEARIENTERCIASGMDIRYGVLLDGEYGTGKTLYAFKLAAKAVKRDWTFVYCPNPEHSLEAMKMAKRYCGNGKGLVLFIEDGI